MREALETQALLAQTPVNLHAQAYSLGVAQKLLTKLRPAKVLWREPAMRGMVNTGDPPEEGAEAIPVQVVAGAGAEVKVALHRIVTLGVEVGDGVEVDNEVEVGEAKPTWTTILWINLSQWFWLVGVR